jgi:hypothetical protein
MMTQEEMKRWRGRFEAHAILDPDLKPDILKDQIKAVVVELEAKLKKTKRKVAVFFGEMK